jgi:hypothetical protein
VNPDCQAVLSIGCGVTALDDRLAIALEYNAFVGAYQCQMQKALVQSTALGRDCAREIIKFVWHERAICWDALLMRHG